YSASLSGQLQNGIGNTTASIAHYQQRGRGETGYSGSHSSGFALGRRGFYWSGANGAEAGLAVQVDGFDDADLHGVAAELQVGGLRRQRLQIGERRLLPLS
ncbi:usher protein, partial [bacterium M00.F.Ca.ET.221.01.1.1]